MSSSFLPKEVILITEKDKNRFPSRVSGSLPAVSLIILMLSENCVLYPWEEPCWKFPQKISILLRFELKLKIRKKNIFHKNIMILFLCLLL